MSLLKKILSILVCVTLIGACASKVSSIKQDVDINIDQDEGYLMFSVDTKVDLAEIHIQGEKDIILTKEDLRKGTNTILLPMPKGEYYFDRVILTRSNYGYSYVDLNRSMWQFKTSPNKISYVGHVNVEAKRFNSDVSLTLVNRASEALAYLQDNFANILSNRDLEYQGPGEDSFFRLMNAKSSQTDNTSAAESINACLLPDCYETKTDANNAEDLLNPDDLFRRFETQSLKLSPDAKYALTYLIVEGLHQFFVIDTESFKRTELFSFGGRNSSMHSMSWIDTDTIFINYTFDAEKKAKFINLTQSEDKLLLDNQYFKLNGSILDPLEHEQEKLLFSGNEKSEGKSYKVLYWITPQQLLDGDFSNAQKLPNQLKSALFYRADEHEREILAVTLEDEVGVIWRRGYDQNSWIELARLGVSKHNFEPVALLNETTLAVLSNEQSDKIVLREFDFQQQKYGKVLYEHEQYDLVDARISKDGKRVEAVQYISHGLPVTEYFAEKEQAIEEIVKAQMPNKQFLLLDEKPDSSKKLLYLFEPGDPGDYYVLDQHTRQLNQVASAMPQLKDAAKPSYQFYEVNVDSDTAVEAMLSKPGSNANGVLLVMPHGGPIGIQSTSTFDRAERFLNDRGYAVLKVNFRGSAGYGKKFQALGVGQFGKNIENDISAVVAKVTEQHAFKHMCSIGSSYGGYSALMLSIQNPELYDCTVAMYGIYDLPLVFNSVNFEMSEFYQQAVEDVIGENSEKLIEVSPVYLAEKINVPLLLMAGLKDEIAWYEQTNRLAFRLEQLNKPFDLITYKHVGHGHNYYSGEYFQWAYIDDFIRRQLALPVPMTDKNREQIKDEYVHIADYFINNNLINSKDNSAKEWSYLRKAAAMGHVRSMFNIGSFYHRGEFVEKNIETAMQWYTKASDAGFVDASYRLAHMYADGDAGQPDHEKAMMYFQRSVEQEHKEAFFYIARGLCLGNGVAKDIDACIEKLSFKTRYNSEQWKKRDKIIAQLFWDEALPSDTKARLKQLIAQLYGTVDYQGGFEVAEWGYFSPSPKVSLPYKEAYVSRHQPIYLHKGTDSEIPIPPRTGDLYSRYKIRAFGVQLAMLNPQKDKFVALKVRWTQPRVKDLKVTGEVIRETIRYFNAGYEHIEIMEELSPFSAWKELESDWRLEVFTLDNQLLFDKQFKTVK